MEIKKLHIGSQTLKRYADLDYDEWYAMAEFVDNSLHSFLNNKAVLKRDCQIDSCEVKISIPTNTSDRQEEIHITDNAGGIHYEDFDRLISLGVKKEKSDHQLSEFGMGMKTAAVWFGNHIEIETKHHAQNQCYKITIDIDRLGQDDEVTIEEVIPSSNLRGYTKIKLTKLNRSLNRKKRKIKDSMSSIYRKFIENGDMQISFEDEVLSPITVNLATDSTGAELRKDFEIVLENGKKCKGWIGIMEKGLTKMSGFSVYRFNRLIQGYPENSWRPAEVFSAEGGSNTSKNQRLIGELDMTDFKVAHTKNKINFVGDEEGEFRDQLGDFCKDIAREASKSKKPKTAKEHQDTPNIKVTKDELSTHFQNPKSTDVKNLEIIKSAVKPKTPDTIQKIYKNEEPFLHFPDMKTIPGIEKEVLIYHFIDNHQPYMILDVIEEKLIICINITHPYYQNIDQNGTSDQTREYHLNCIFDALSELHCFKKYGAYQPDDMRLTKDLFLKRWIESLGLEQ